MRLKTQHLEREGDKLNAENEAQTAVRRELENRSRVLVELNGKLNSELEEFIVTDEEIRR